MIGTWLKSAMTFLGLGTQARAVLSALGLGAVITWLFGRPTTRIIQGVDNQTIMVLAGVGALAIFMMRRK